MKFSEIPEGVRVDIIPDNFVTNQGYHMEVLLRGVSCYILKNWHKPNNPYRVQERIIEPSMEGYQEMLSDTAHYTRFEKLSDAKKHFTRVEKGLCEVMEYLRI